MLPEEKKGKNKQWNKCWERQRREKQDTEKKESGKKTGKQKQLQKSGILYYFTGEINASETKS